MTLVVPSTANMNPALAAASKKPAGAKAQLFFEAQAAHRSPMPEDMG